MNSLAVRGQGSRVSLFTSTTVTMWLSSRGASSAGPLCGFECRPGACSLALQLQAPTVIALAGQHEADLRGDRDVGIECLYDRPHDPVEGWPWHASAWGRADRIRGLLTIKCAFLRAYVGRYLACRAGSESLAPFATFSTNRRSRSFRLLSSTMSLLSVASGRPHASLQLYRRSSLKKDADQPRKADHQDRGGLQ